MAEPQPASSQRSNLTLRILAALVLAPVAIAAAWFGGWFWHLLATLVAIGLYAEWISVIGLKQDRRILIAGSVAILALSAALAGHAMSVGALLAVAGIVAMVALAPPSLRIWAATGFIYAAAAMVASVLLRADMQFGFPAILFVFAVVWASDILGYFVGRAVGGPKLWERVSPKKTWAGAIGGLVGAVAGTFVVAIAILGVISPILAVIGAVLSVVSQAGDLFESAVKRRFDVKDSSQIIPGHGGLMDRLDGFIVVVVAACLIGLWRAGPDTAARGLLLW
jgi:phosphatidate cytidylyltransferase